MDEIIYLDCASLLPPRERVLATVARSSREAWGNPHALHPVGHRASEALERARIQVAEYLDAPASEVIFVSSGRDAMLRGIALALQQVPSPVGPIVSSRLEHPSTVRLVESAAEKSNREIVWLEMPEGVLSETDRARLEDASLVVLSLVNHEMGTVVPFEHLATKGMRVIDAVQAAPWLSLARLHDEQTLYAVSAAKIGGPMGVGVLRVPAQLYYGARDTNEPLEPESPPWMAAVALGEACADREGRETRLAIARQRSERLLAGMRQLAPDVLLNGAEGSRLGPIVNASFPGTIGKNLAAQLAFHRVCIAHTAACRSRVEAQSPVVRAAYPMDPTRAQAATRWSLYEATTEHEVDRALEVLGSLFARAPRDHSAPCAALSCSR